MDENSNFNKETSIKAMLKKLREIDYRSKKALKKSELSGLKEDKKFEKELASFQKKYGEI
ncbi:MAG: hypothetical protein EBR30_05315 [Cytophagia bacterium]|nr:hypothetical protein [Cytophagia bacterium]